MKSKRNLWDCFWVGFFTCVGLYLLLWGIISIAGKVIEFEENRIIDKVANKYILYHTNDLPSFPSYSIKSDSMTTATLKCNSGYHIAWGLDGTVRCE